MKRKELFYGEYMKYDAKNCILETLQHPMLHGNHMIDTGHYDKLWNDAFGQVGIDNKSGCIH